MTDLVARARAFAIREHRRIDHRRKYSKQPYDVHLKAVADLVAGVTDDPEMIAAAWLHDVVEDTPVTFDDVAREFGGAVARLVDELTDVSRPGDGNRAARKAIDRAHLAAASPRAKTIKLADLADNARDICRHDAGFGRVYLAEMEALLGVLGEGHAKLMAKARETHAYWREHVASSKEAGEGEPPRQTRWHEDEVRSTWRQLNTFSVADLARPLPADAPDAIAAEQIIDAGAPISVMVHVLTRYERAFVRTADRISGVLSRSDLEKPIGRMWLFGIVTLIEFDFIRRICARWPDQGWAALLSPGRLDKAHALQEERARRGQPAELLDCLQLADKGLILIHDPDVLRDWDTAASSPPRPPWPTSSRCETTSRIRRRSSSITGTRSPVSRAASTIGCWSRGRSSRADGRSGARIRRGRGLRLGGGSRGLVRDPRDSVLRFLHGPRHIGHQQLELVLGSEKLRPLETHVPGTPISRLDGGGDPGSSIRGQR